MDNNLKIADHEIIRAEKMVLAYAENLISSGQQYNTLIDSISEEAFQDVLITEKLKSLVSDMNKIISFLESFEDSLNHKAKDFIKDIDEKDKFIY